MRAATMALPLVLAGCAAGPAAPVSGDGLIVAFGDSYTEGFGAPPERAYPATLARSLERPVLNKGVSGETAGEAARRLDRDVIRNNPDVVIVEFGVNEAFRGYPLERALADLDALVARIRADTDAKIVIVGVRFWTFQEDFDAGLRAVAQRHDAGLVLDVLDGIVSSERDRDDGDPKLRSDAYHPNAAGYALMAARIQPAVEAQLAP